MEEILYIDEHQIVYKWRCLSILICWIEHDNDFFCVIVYLYQRPLELSWFSLWVATRECTMQSWSPKSAVAFQRLDSSVRCRSGNGTEGLIKILQCDTSTKLRLGHSTLCKGSPPTPLFHPSLLILKKFYLGKIFQVQYGIQNCYSHNWYLFYTDFVRSMR